MFTLSYTGASVGAASRMVVAFMLAVTLSGCSMSPFGGEQPKTTGSIPATVEVTGPIPQTLAFSDAAKIGEAANATLMLASGARSGDWINVATGSSGTVETVDLPNPPAGCRPFSTTVTSIGGVHNYSGAICNASGGRPRVTIDERAPSDRT